MRTRTISEPSGFTLLELMVAASVMLLLLGLALNLVAASSRIFRGSGNGMSAATAARFALDVIGNDWASRVRREELPVNFISQPGNDEIRFYGAVPSVLPSGADARGIALVAYRVRTASGLERAASGAGWSGSFPSLPFAVPTAAQTAGEPADADFDVASPAVFRLEVCVLDRSGNILAAAPQVPRDFHRNVAAVVASVAVMDAESRKKLSSPEAALDGLVGQMKDAADGEIPAQAWLRQFDDIAGLSRRTGIPAEALAAVRIVERVYYVP